MNFLPQIDSCEYKSFKENHVVIDEGRNIQGIWINNIEECKKYCEKAHGCKSFSLCKGSTRDQCWLKDKTLDGSEVNHFKTNHACTTHFRHCGK